MKGIYIKVDEIKSHVRPGENLRDAIPEAVVLAFNKNTPVRLSCNGTDVVLDPKLMIEQIENIFEKETIKNGKMK